MFRTAFFCGLFATVLTACPARSVPVSTPKETKQIDKKPSAKLVLVVVLDQMPSSALLRYAPYLPKDGALRRAIEGGLYQERVRYDYAGTNTAPGHSSIYTGENPADHGIDSNDWYNYEAKSRMKIINDQKTSVFGVEAAFASPVKLLKPTLGDVLHQQSPSSKVVSVSLKARAAVVSGGHTADFVTWYDPRLPGFTTSTAYADEMPEWLSEWNRENPVLERIVEWTAGDPKTYETLLGPDDVKGESDWYGLGTTFPHPAQSTEKPTKTFVATPQSAEYLLDMTRKLVEQYDLGGDEAPDLLSVSISSTDYAGHSFSVRSWEYMDVLLKTDKALGLLIDELSQKTELSVLITSDHGGTPLAEATLAKGLPGGRMGGEEMVAELELLADEKLGEGDWIQTFIQPYLYLTEAAMQSDKRTALDELIADYAKQREDIEAIYPAELARSFRTKEKSLQRDVANTVAQRTVALYVVPAQGYVASGSRDGAGTGHGTPWIEDREVPVLAFGAGVSKATGSAVMEQNRVAATIAALLGIDWHLPAKPLPGAPSK